ncbi:MAG: hypothetical protein HRU11_03315 [Parvularculaceae bacterium]|nr:hypothetical protein [Parvularculaceae bacterium]
MRAFGLGLVLLAVMAMEPSALAQSKKKKPAPAPTPVQEEATITEALAVSGLRTDGTRAYRFTVGDIPTIRCRAFDRDTGRDLTNNEINARLGSGIRPRWVQGPGRVLGSRDGVYSFGSNQPGVTAVACEPFTRTGRPYTARIPTIVSEEAVLDNRLVKAWFTAEGDTDPIRRASVGQPLKLVVRRFEDQHRKEIIKDGVQEITWRRGSDKCDSSGGMLPFNTFSRRITAQRDRTRTLTQELTFGVAGRYTACVRLLRGDGEFDDIEVPIEIKDDAESPKVEPLSITQARSGFVDTTPSERDRPLAKYEVRTVIFDPNPAELKVTFESFSGQVPGRMVNRVGDRAVFAAELPFEDGQQIVTARVADGAGNKTTRSVIFVAGKDMISPLANSDNDRARSRTEIVFDAGILDNQGTDLPSSLEQALRNIDLATWRTLIPPTRINEEINVAEAIGAGSIGNFMVDVSGLFSVSGVSVDVTRGQPHRIRLNVKFKSDAKATCFTRAYANTKLPRSCAPVFPEDGLTVKVTGDVTVNAVVDRAPGSQQRILYGFHFDENDVSSNLSIENDAIIGANGFINDQIRNEVKPMLTAKGLQRMVFGCKFYTDGSSECNPKAPLSARQYRGDWWFGFELPNLRPLEQDVPIPMVLAPREADGSLAMVEGTFTSGTNDVFLGNPWLRASTIGGLTRKDGQFFADNDYLRYRDPMDRASNPPVESAKALAASLTPPVSAHAMVLTHLDTVNGYLASLHAAGSFLIDMSGPEFVDLIEPDPARQAGSPFAALKYFKRSKVRLTPDRAPRLTRRTDFGDTYVLELNGIDLEIDLGVSHFDYPADIKDNRLRARIGLAMAVDLETDRGKLVLNTRQGRRCINSPRTFVDPTQCSFRAKIDLIERTGFTRWALMPYISDPSEQAALTASWDRLRVTLGIAGALDRQRRQTVRSSWASDYEGAARLILLAQLPKFMPLEIDLPQLPLLSALPLPIKDEDKLVLEKLTLLPRPDRDDGWLAFVAEAVPEAEANSLREQWAQEREAEDEE